MFYRKIITVIFTLISIPTYASIIDYNQDTYRENHYIFDSKTGLDWRELSRNNINRTYNTVSEQINNGVYGDWRLATFDEVNTLIENFLDHAPDIGFSIGNYPLRELATIMGISGSGHNRYTIGRTADTYTSTRHVTYSRIISFGYNSGSSEYVNKGIYEVSQIGVKGSKSDTGFFMVRESQHTSIQEPSNLALFSIGLIGLSFTHRKKQRQWKTN